MKKTTILIMFLLCVTTASVYGQTKKKMIAGLKTGINYSTLNGRIGEDIYSRLGFNIGGYTRYYLTEDFHVQSDLVYTSKGTALDIEIPLKPSGTDILTLTCVIYYIEFSPLLNYRFPVSSSAPIVPHIFIGPAIAFKTAAFITASAASTGASKDYNLKEIENIDYGVIFGFKFLFPIDEADINLELRYNLGLAKYNINELLYFSDVQNRVFSLSIGYTL